MEQQYRLLNADAAKQKHSRASGFQAPLTEFTDATYSATCSALLASVGVNQSICLWARSKSIPSGYSITDIGTGDYFPLLFYGMDHQILVHP